MVYAKFVGLVSKLTMVLVFLVVCGSVSAATPVPETPAPTPTPIPPAVTSTPRPTVEMIRDEITSRALEGNLLDDPTERTIYVLLPPGYAESDRRYPVVYVMPWGEGLPYENAAQFRWAMQWLLRAGEIQEMIVVVPDGSNRLGCSHFRSSPAIGDYDTYVTQEVIDYVDSHYRTLATRDSRGIGGCSNGGDASMRLGLKYPNIYSVITSRAGSLNYSLEVWPSDLEWVQGLTEVPQDISDLSPLGPSGWWVQVAAGVAPDQDNPPFYCEMPFRIVDGRGEFVPEVVAKVVETDAANEARRYVQQPVRLRGILLQHDLFDTDFEKSIRSFEQLLTELGIEHEYVEAQSTHCGQGWQEDSLKFMSDNLAFEER